MNFREWYMTEYFMEYEIIDYVTGRTAKSFNQMGGVALILNLNEQKDANCTMTFYYQANDPMQYKLSVPAGRQGLVWFGDQRFGTVPPGIDFSQRFGLKITSDEPIIVQSTQGDAKLNDLVTNSMVTQMFYPGPLTKKHCEWYYIDCIVITAEGNPLEEREWLSVLNPQPKDAEVKITFIPGGTFKFPEAILEMDDPNICKTEYKITVKGERLLPLDVYKIPGVMPNQHYAVRVSSTEPVTIMGIRRIYKRGEYDYSTSVAFLDAIPTGKESNGKNVIK